MQVPSLDMTVVVAGNGPSIKDVTPGQVLATDRIIRMNNFYFEPETWLGNRVDLFLAAGDPRVAPFSLSTLKTCLDEYDIRGWSSFNPRIVRSGRKILPVPYFDMPLYADYGFAAQAQAVMARFDVKPMTGTLALLIAYAAGARRFVVAGIDLYSSTQRYMYHPGPHQRALMGRDLAERGVDVRLHNHTLDLELIRLLARQPDVEIHHANCAGSLAEFLPVAPVRQGDIPHRRRRQPPSDWVPFSGAYPIHLLRLLRRIRSTQMRLSDRVRIGALKPFRN
jgi:hypothetical protein